MKVWLTKIETNYNLLGKNHKIAVISATFFLLFVIWLSFLSNLLAVMDKNKKNIVQEKSEIAVLKKQVTVLKTSKIENKNDQYGKEEAQLKKQLDDMDKKIESFHYQLVSPKAIFSSLKNMLDESQGARLISAQYLPEELVKDTGNQPVFHSSIEFTIQGTFPEILAYLKHAEKNNTFIFWDEMDYKVTQYPIALLKLKIHVVTKEAEQENAVVH